MLTRATALAAWMALVLSRGAQSLELPTPCPGCVRFPATTVSWQWQLDGTIDPAVAADVYDIDGAVHGADVVQQLHDQGRRVICYFSAGTWERFRPDAAGFPAESIGKPLRDFPDESWLDIRRIDRLAPVLLARLDLCRAKGFDAVEPDNVDAYRNDSGFPLTAEDQLTFNTWIAAEAHRRGLSVGLKNDAEQVDVLQPYFDFAVVEQCFQFKECGSYTPFVTNDKAVFAAEYRVRPARFCGRSRRLGFSTIFKRRSLGSFRRGCPARPVGSLTSSPNAPTRRRASLLRRVPPLVP
jgi:hypothetical protein